MAGASLAAELTGAGSIVLIEAEDQPGYHATGRSAAFWTESYGGPGVQPLTTASGPWLAEHGFLKQRGSLSVATLHDAALLDDFERDFADSGVAFDRLDRAQVATLIPGSNQTLAAGVFEPSCCDIDVGGLHNFYLGAFRRGGGTVRTDFRVTRVDRLADIWKIGAGAKTIEARVLVNAAGAWADGLAAMAGIGPLGIRAYRRTIAQVRLDRPVPADMPLVIDIAGRFYFKPESAQRLWLSPHDETLAEPGDAAPEELDVATAIARLEAVVDWRVVKVERKWAGLRSFAPDRLPVYGFDSRDSGFYWCAGQGGFGIQTAPAAARLAAAEIMRGSSDSRYGPARFG